MVGRPLAIRSSHQFFRRHRFTAVFHDYHAAACEGLVVSKVIDAVLEYAVVPANVRLLFLLGPFFLTFIRKPGTTELSVEQPNFSFLFLNV